MTAPHGSRTRLAEVVAVLAMAAGLGLGLPVEYAIRSCIVAVDLGRRAGLTDSELSDLTAAGATKSARIRGGSPPPPRR